MEVIEPLTTEVVSADDGQLAEDDKSFLEPDDPGPQPPDGGYGWVIVFAGLMVNVIGGCADAYGVFYMHLLEYYRESNATTAWPGAICYALILMAGPVASYVCHRFSHRTCCILGGVVGAAGILASAFVTNIYVMYFTYGIVAGTGFCLQYLSATLIVGYYFDKRRTFAMCIGVTGVCLGDFIMPPLVEYLSDRYAWQGAMILMAAVSLHACVFGALMRPLPGISTHRDKPSCDVGILKDTRFLLYCAAEALWGVGCAIFFTIISDFAYHEGRTKEEGAWLLSAMGVSSAFSRIVVAFAANGSKCNRLLLYGLSLAISIAPLVALPYTKIYELYVFYSVVYGLTYGIIAGLSPVIVADVFGLEQMTVAYGYVILFDGVMALVGPPIAGWLKDISGNYELSWLFCGLCTVFGVIACFTLIALNRYRPKLRHTDLQVLELA